jgi:hypothetical protein
MNATFGTNNAGMDLFCGAGGVRRYRSSFSICCFEEVFENYGKGEHRAILGAISGILLCQFLGYLRISDLSPTFFGTDKDMPDFCRV